MQAQLAPLIIHQVDQSKNYKFKFTVELRKKQNDDSEVGVHITQLFSIDKAFMNFTGLSNVKSCSFKIMLLIYTSYFDNTALYYHHQNF